MGGSADIDHGIWRYETQQQAQIAWTQGYAALGRRPVRMHQMDEHGAPSALDARAMVVINFNNKIIQMIVAPHLLATISGGQPDMAVVGASPGCVAPAVRSPQGNGGQAGKRPFNPVGPVENPAGMEASPGRYSVAFSFQPLGSHPVSAYYAWKAHETCNQGCASVVPWSLINNHARNFFHAGRLELQQPQTD